MLHGNFSTNFIESQGIGSAFIDDKNLTIGRCAHGCLRILSSNIYYKRTSKEVSQDKGFPICALIKLICTQKIWPLEIYQEHLFVSRELDEENGWINRSSFHTGVLSYFDIIEVSWLLGITISHSLELYTMLKSVNS